jgi:signal transduction histidine kinase
LAGQKCLLKADSAEKYSIESIIQEHNFETIPNEHLLIGSGERQTAWLKWTIHNPQAEFAFLEFTYPLLDSATLYTVEDGNILEKQLSGIGFLQHQRFIESKNIVFKIKQSQKPLTYYCKVKSRWYCNIKPRISTIKSFVRNQHFDDMIQGIFIGIAGIFILYNFFVFIQLKNTVYIYYCLYLFCIAFFIIRHNGYVTEFIFRTTPQFNDLTFAMTGLSGIFGTLFTMRFLDTKSNLPIFHRVFQGLLIVYILYTILLVSNEMYWTVILSQILLPVGTSLVFIVSIILWRKGNPSVNYFFIGWLGLFISQIIFIFEYRGLIDSNFFTAYAGHIGIAFEATVLSFAIANRFRLLKLNEEKAQANLIEVLKLNEQLTLDKNRFLEQKVTERTTELQNAMIQLLDSEEKLQDYAQRLEKSNKELTDFAHIASHDLKAPIRGILSFIQLLERRSKSKFDPTDLEYFNFIKNNAHQLIKIWVTLQRLISISA